MTANSAHPPSNEPSHYTHNVKSNYPPIKLATPISQNGLPSKSPTLSAIPPFRPQQTDERGIVEINAEIERRVANMHAVPMGRLLESAGSSFDEAQINLNMRGTHFRNEAYIQFSVSQKIISQEVVKNKDWVLMSSGDSPSLNKRRYDMLKDKIRNQSSQFDNMRKIMEQEALRNSSPPAKVLPSQASPSMSMSMTVSASTPSSLSSVPHQTLANNTQNHVPPLHEKHKPPPIRPKPISLVGHSADELTKRFAALRTSSISPRKPVGPRQMPIPLPDDFYNMPSPRNTVSMTPIAPITSPTPPTPVYSPARNMYTPSTIDPPRTSQRSLNGTGGRSHSYSASLSNPLPANSLHSPPLPPLPPFSPLAPFSPPLNPTSTKRQAIFGPPAEFPNMSALDLPANYPKIPDDDTTISTTTLRQLLPYQQILLFDVRNRYDFDQGHVKYEKIICIDPLHLRQGVSASNIQDSLSISSDADCLLFSKLSLVDRIVYYDHSSQNTNFITAKESDLTDADAKLNILYKALGFNNVEESLKLKKRPLLLKGGISAWIELVGPTALQASKTQTEEINRRRSSASTLLPPGSAKKFHFPDADEHSKWFGQDHDDSSTIHSLSEIKEQEDIDSDKGPLFQSTEDFMRRYPEVLTPQSMVDPLHPPQSPAHPPPSSVPQPNSTQMTLRPGQSSFLMNAYAAMPMRPPPAAQKFNYSGAHDVRLPPAFAAIRSQASPSLQRPLRVCLPRIGLANFGATCYMNSVFQCLNATVPLSTYFVENTYMRDLQKNDKNELRGILPLSYAYLVRYMWLDGAKNGNRPITPHDFRKYCHRLEPEWGSSKQQDASEFYDSVIQDLHEGLNVAWRKPAAHPLTADEEARREKSPIFFASSIEWNRWCTRENSEISNLFAGQHASQSRCSACQNTSTIYEQWYALNVEFVAREQKLLSRDKKVNLVDCLASYCQGEKTDWICPRCKSSSNSSKKLILTRAPPCLVIQLKRFGSNKKGVPTKNNSNVNFPLNNLDLGPFMAPVPTSPEDIHRAESNNLDMGPYLYNAYAIVEHHGPDIDHGHYIAWVNDRGTGTWRQFNDSYVWDTKSFKPEGAYLLFYERVRA